MKLEEIKELVLLFDSTQSTKLHIQRGDFVLKLEKGHATKAEPQTIMVQAPLVQKDSDDDITPLPKKEGDTLTSPMVGTFYRSPSPGSAAYVQVGDKVKKGQTLAIIEAGINEKEPTPSGFILSAVRSSSVLPLHSGR